MQANTLRRWMVIGAALVALSGLSLQASPITYTYTGANFNPSTFRTDGTGSGGDLIIFSSSNYVTGSVTLDGPLPDSSSLTSYSGHVLSWSLSVVGGFAMSSANGNQLVEASFGTTGGNINSWNVFSNDGFPVPGQPASWQVARIQTSSSTAVTTTQLCTDCVVYDGGLDGSFAQQVINNGGSLTAGQWSSSVTEAAPEPGTLAMLFGGIAVLATKFGRNPRHI